MLSLCRASFLTRARLRKPVPYPRLGLSLRTLATMDVDNPSAPTASTSTPSATAPKFSGTIDPATSIIVPEGLRLHTENTTHLLLAADEAFLNPVQEFNRDLSIACIRTWSEMREKERQAKREAGRARKRAKAAKDAEAKDGGGKQEGEAPKEVEAEASKVRPPQTSHTQCRLSAASTPQGYHP